MEADAHSLLGNKNNILIVVGRLDFDQLIAFPERDGLQAVLSDVLVLADPAALYDTGFCGHEQILVVFVQLFHGDKGGYLLVLLQRNQVDDRRSSGCSSRFRNLVGLKPVHPSPVGKEHQAVEIGRHQQVIQIILIDGGHAADSLSAAVLALEIIGGHSLDVTQVGHGDDHVIIRNHILFVDLVLIPADACSSVIAVAVFYFGDLFADHAEKQLLIAENRSPLSDLSLQLLVFGKKLLPFQTCQSAETHVHDGLGLGVRESEGSDQVCLCLRHIGSRPDNPDDFVDDIQRLEKTFQNVGPFFRLIQIVLCSAGDHILLMLKIVGKHFQEIHDAGLIVHQSQHNHAEGILQLGVPEQLI